MLHFENFSLGGDGEALVNNFFEADRVI